jgi:FKBP-type peptidyl-prolyl cis-trans isomerase FkpA
MKQLSQSEKIAVVIGVAIFIFLVGTAWFERDAATAQQDSNGDTEFTTFNPEKIMEQAQENDALTINRKVEGTGKVATPGSTVAVHYVLSDKEQKIIDTSYINGDPFTFTLGQGQVIKGWEEGVLGMREGERRELIVSPEFAYGDDPEAHPLGGQTLYFEVLMLDVVEQGEVDGDNENVDSNV